MFNETLCLEYDDLVPCLLFHQRPELALVHGGTDGWRSQAVLSDRMMDALEIEEQQLQDITNWKERKEKPSYIKSIFSRSSRK